MGKPRLTKIKELEECPYFMTVEQVVEFMGFGRPVVDKWFRDKTFPAINDGTQKVNKYALMDWINMKYGSYVYNSNFSKTTIVQAFKEVIEEQKGAEEHAI